MSIGRTVDHVAVLVQERQVFEGGVVIFEVSLVEAVVLRAAIGAHITEGLMLTPEEVQGVFNCLIFVLTLI